MSDAFALSGRERLRRRLGGGLQVSSPLKISVIGTGYLGAVHAACMAQIGHTVVAIDKDATKIDTLRCGRSPFFEPGLDELLDEVLDTGRLRFSTQFADAGDCDVHFLCVGTPQLAGSFAADTSQVYSAAKELAPHLRPETLVVGKSTVPVGTANDLRNAMQHLAPSGVTVRLAWNPEFLREGSAIRDTVEPDRLVYGVDGPRASDDVQVLDRVYAHASHELIPRVIADYATAELVKSAANAFLATKISFINAMAELCEATDADVVRLAQALGHDARIGPQFLKAGLGFGGGCLPKDIRAFVARADELGAGQTLTFLREVDAINQRRRERVVALAADELGGTLSSKRIAVLGAAFKPGSDDVRDSPALAVASTLHHAGAHVSIHDPKAIHNARSVYPELHFAGSVSEAVAEADILLVLTEWSEYATLDPAATGGLVRHRTVIDARNCLDASAWTSSGWRYIGLGRPVEYPSIEAARQLIA